MTASQRTHATSNNSVPRSSQVGTESITPKRGPRLRSIVQHVNNRNGAITAAGIAAEAGWTRNESGENISRMQAANLVQLLDDLREPVPLLTAKGERFVQEVEF